VAIPVVGHSMHYILSISWAIKNRILQKVQISYANVFRIAVV